MAWAINASIGWPLGKYYTLHFGIAADAAICYLILVFSFSCFTNVRVSDDWVASRTTTITTKTRALDTNQCAWPVQSWHIFFFFTFFRIEETKRKLRMKKKFRCCLSLTSLLQWAAAHTHCQPWSPATRVPHRTIAGSYSYSIALQNCTEPEHKNHVHTMNVLQFFFLCFFFSFFFAFCVP